ncbi:MAG: hypothetical protein EFT35_08535 [Methanophagales archaeon ANME-1-THS]|nr:MAG: hypothetical protein EFT35_08535 [Methanophagales archaeon ANME-1-THS]
MVTVSIILPQKFGKKLREKAEEAGYLPEELAFEFLCKSLNEELDPEELVEHYQSLSDKYLREAKELMKKGDIVQASEKFWGASALAVKRIGAKRGLKLEKHGSLWAFVDTLAKENRDKEIVISFHVANGLHKNFFENEMPKEAVEVSAEDIEKLIDKLRRIS